MPNFIKNLGLGFLWDEEESANNFINFLAHDAKPIVGYYGRPTLFKCIGSIDFFISTELKKDEHIMEIVGFDTHCSGPNVWTLRNVGIDITPENSLPTSRVFMFKNHADGVGMIPVHIINADVLPSFLEDDVVELQMCAFPLDISYYEDDDAYANDQPKSKTGKQWLLADGSLIATGFLHNHQVSNKEASTDCSTDDHVLFKGTVKRIDPGIFTIGDDKNIQTYIRCVIDTPYGELELAHTIEQVDEKQRENIKVGSVVFGVCILSGDASIYDYEDGFVKDFDRNFKLLRHVLVKGQAERMRHVLCDDVVYISDESETSYNGIDEIIGRFNVVNEAQGDKCFATPATITEIDDEGLDYPVGTRCLLISYETEDDYSAIAFLDVNEEGKIKRIYISTDSRYHFKADEKLRDPSPLDNIKIPESVIEPIYMRAKYHDMIDAELELEELVQGIKDGYAWQNNIENMLEALKENPQPDIEVDLENLFGYLFAKAIEMTVNENKRETFDTTLIASYSPEDAFNGEIYSELDEEEHRELVEAMELGKQFYKDFKHFTEMQDGNEENFMENITTSLILVQHIGTLYAERIFN